MLRPLGPVAVFSASNFPFAFSVAGGDTASALAAGCPVIVKGHSAHPRLSRRTAEVVADALAAAGAPEGVFGHVEGREAGVALVQHPEIRAVGFTGSLHGGRALFDLASSRPDPIPFYGELSAVNPVLITAAALDARADELASGLAASFTLGAGQFCTNPGVVFVPAGSGFAERVAAAVGQPGPVPMLTDGIAAAFADGLAGLAAHDGVEVVAGEAAQQPGTGSAVVLSTTTAAVLADPGALLAECFGPSTLVVEYDDVDDALAAIRSVGGSLTATVHAEPGEDLADILAVLTEVAGRVLFAGWPTGVAVSWAQQHGGPWPSTTSIHTSVGVTAIRRFLRPVAYQDAPDAALPARAARVEPARHPAPRRRSARRCPARRATEWASRATSPRPPRLASRWAASSWRSPCWRSSSSATSRSAGCSPPRPSDPSIVAAPIVGAVLDRTRRPGAFVAGAGLVTAAAFTVAAFLGVVPAGVVALALVVAGIATPFVMGGLSSFVTEVIPEERRAYAIDALAYNLGAVAGPAAVAAAAAFGSARLATLLMAGSALLGASGRSRCGSARSPASRTPRCCAPSPPGSGTSRRTGRSR